MSNIPKISKEILTQIAQKSNNQDKKENVQTPSFSKLEPKDKSSVIPMKNWIELLKTMPEENVEKMMAKYHEEQLKEIGDKITSSYYEENFEEEIFPRLFNEISKDWGLLK